MNNPTIDRLDDWIPCGSRMPPVDFHNRVEVLYGGFVELARHAPCPEFVWRGDDGYFLTSEVTHWRPLIETIVSPTKEK